MDFDADLVGIANLMRRHIEIRNRSWMKRIHRDCFLGSDAVDFLVTQGFADSRKAAVELGLKMTGKKLFRNITDTKKFSDSMHYYRFFDDDQSASVLGRYYTGNSLGGSSLGHGGCKWSFAPHTAHNSYILDIALAEEIERAVGGASTEARALAINKLRARVREQAEVDAPNWQLVQRKLINQQQAAVSTYHRTRPRGDWKNVKMTAVIGESPVGFMRNIANFEKRMVWEHSHEEGLVIEALDTGERPCAILLDEDLLLAANKKLPGGVAGKAAASAGPQAEGSQLPSPPPLLHSNQITMIPLSEAAMKQAQQRSNPVARATDDVYSFLQTVDLAGIPANMAIAFLNDPERQHALAYLRKQMMLSSPQECMLCSATFSSHADIRFCPCCAMVSCTGCVSKRVFEVVSRSITSVCVHCYRESSRIFQPPQMVQDERAIDSALRGKWWRPEELGLVDYSGSSYRASIVQENPLAAAATANTKGKTAASMMKEESSLYNDNDDLIVTAANVHGIQPLIPGLLDDILSGSSLQPQPQQPQAAHRVVSMSLAAINNLSDGEEDEEGDDDNGEEARESGVLDSEGRTEMIAQRQQQRKNDGATMVGDTSSSQPPPSTAAAAADQPQQQQQQQQQKDLLKTARCKGCGQMISRDIESIEYHMQHECSRSLIVTEDSGLSGGSAGRASVAAASPNVKRSSFLSSFTSRRFASVDTRTQYGGSSSPLRGRGEESKSPIPTSTAASQQAQQQRRTITTADGGNYILDPETNEVLVTIPPVVNKIWLSLPRASKAITQSANSRIVYRTARCLQQSTLAQFYPREACLLQDMFVDEASGAVYLYEISVRHSEVQGVSRVSGNPQEVQNGLVSSYYQTSDIMTLIYVARPIKGHPNACMLTVLSQVDDHYKKRSAASREESDALHAAIPSINPTSSAFQYHLPLMMISQADLVEEIENSNSSRDVPRLLSLSDWLEHQQQFGQGSSTGEDGQAGEDGDLVTLDNFELLAVLGRGGFGKVMQVRYKDTGMIYAMKILKKTELRRRRQVERTQTERNILAAVRHPFIVCLHYAFQNSQKLYMVMDFVQGGDFFTLMRKFRRLPEEWVRLYVMEVAMALQHLHDREIVYRDLKPENILLCADGHLKLTDFGLSRFFETRPPNPEDIVESVNTNSGNAQRDVVTRSFCGTEQYMSPEMLLQQGHNYRMDWWCLGLLMHEMITGRHPFHGQTHYDTLRNMVTKPPNIDARISPPAAQVIKALLIKNPRARLGGKEGINELQRAPFLSMVSWDALFKKQVEMPYKPKVQDDADISSFETTFTKEKPIDSVPETSAADKKSHVNAANGGGEGKKKGVFSSLMQFATGTGAKDKETGRQLDDKQVEQDAFKDFSFIKSHQEGKDGNEEEGKEAQVEEVEQNMDALNVRSAQSPNALYPPRPPLPAHLIGSNSSATKVAASSMGSSPLRERPVASSLLTQAFNKTGGDNTD